MPLIALTRNVSASITDCALTYLDRRLINVELARQQHQQYENYLRNLGVRVLSLPVADTLPDAVFVEDTAVVVDEIAVMTRPLLPSRQEEVRTVGEVLSRYRPLHYLTAPAHLEGGDVLRVGRTLYVGLSRRTNRQGIEQLASFLEPHAYRVQAVPVRGCLHLKTACTYLGRNTLLADRSCVDIERCGDFEVIDAPAEDSGANALLIGETVLLAASHPEIAAALRTREFEVITLDISELQKAEAGLTCCSIVFTSDSAL